MTTIVNTPGGNNESGSGFLFGVIILIILGVLFFVYGLPAIRGTGGGQQNPAAKIEVSVPTGGGENSGTGQ